MHKTLSSQAFNSRKSLMEHTSCQYHHWEFSIRVSLGLTWSICSQSSFYIDADKSTKNLLKIKRILFRMWYSCWWLKHSTPRMVMLTSQNYKSNYTLHTSHKTRMPILCVQFRSQLHYFGSFSMVLMGICASVSEGDMAVYVQHLDTHSVTSLSQHHHEKVVLHSASFRRAQFLAFHPVHPQWTTTIWLICNLYCN